MDISRRFLRLIVFSAILVCSLPFLASCSRKGQILRVSDTKEVPFSDVVDDLKGARLVFVGELHNRESHHRDQLKVIRALRNADVHLAVGLEMFRSDSDTDLRRWTNGELGQEAFQKIYYDNWGFPWQLYKEILLYIRDNRIPVIGLNISQKITEQVAQHGFASLTEEQIGKLPEVRCDVDRTYENFIRRALGLHAHEEMSFTHFCEAQLLWDSIMAWNLLRFLEQNPEYMVVVLAGNGHAWKRGIPEQVARRLKVPYRVILPEIPGRLQRGNVSLEDTDYLWLSP
jgi:uncharacterized iron-regulated protein